MVIKKGISKRDGAILLTKAKTLAYVLWAEKDDQDYIDLGKSPEFKSLRKNLNKFNKIPEVRKVINQIDNYNQERKNFFEFLDKYNNARSTLLGKIKSNNI